MHQPFDLALPAELEDSLDKLISSLDASGTIDRIWNRDPSVWTGNGEDQWLGWLDIAERELDELDKYDSIANEVGEHADVVLLGMGGSSLCPDVLSKVFNVSQFHVLDSTVPDQVSTVTRSVDPSEALFIVASKSGTTLEPNIFFDHFYEQVKASKGEAAAGKSFIAITDPGSQLEAVARERGLRNVFFGDPKIGGRFSALSVFGMAPAAAMGLDVADLLERADNLAGVCRRGQIAENTGALLGCILGAAQQSGRDKLEILASPSIVSLGAWLEQLVAESTGKNGKAIIPVDLRGGKGTPAGREDRVLVYLRDSSDSAADQEEFYESVAGAGEPVIKIDLTDKAEIGAEFFRWEFATAVAGSVMRINPFDQPDVEAAKVEARKITDKYEETGSLPDDEPFFEGDGFAFFTNEENRVALGTPGSARSLLDSHLERISPGDYAALLSYVEMNDENASLLEQIRRGVERRWSVSTSLQFGPRFLHSTGQAFKGGPNSGVFLQISSDDAGDVAIPERRYSFAVVKEAQARGDFQVLLDRGRRALRIHIKGSAAEGLRRLADYLHSE